MAVTTPAAAGQYLNGTSAYYELHGRGQTREWVSFSNVQTKLIDVKPLKDFSKADQIGTSVRISFTAIATSHCDDFSSGRMGADTSGFPEFGALSPDAHDITTKNSSAATELGKLERLLRVLASVRGRFMYKVGNTVLYDVAPPMNHSGEVGWGTYGGSTNDVAMAVNQTPTISATVTRVISDNTAYVDVEVEFDYIRCTGEANRLNNNLRYRDNIKSLRWYYADNINADSWLTTRVFRGKLELIDRNINAHILRMLVLPPLGLGFKRKSIVLNEAEDGMSLDFEITDEEVYAVPPFPLTEWSGNTTVNFPRLLIGKADVRCDLAINAPRAVPKIFLAGAAMRIIDAKIHWYNSISYAKSVFTTRFQMNDHFEKNGIEANVKLEFVLPKFFPHNNPTTPSGSRANPIWNTLNALYRNNLTYNPDRTEHLGATDFSSSGGEDGYGLQDDGGLGHDRGIFNYSPLRHNTWYPYNDTLYSIAYCALQYPCAAAYARPSIQPVKDAKGGQGGGNDQGDGGNPGGDPNGSQGNRDDLSNESTTTLPAPGDNQATDYPYTRYEISTKMDLDMGIKTFSPMNNVDTLFGESATRIVHQSNAPTETVTLLLDASRIGRWPNGPNELSFRDPVTGILYICESVTTVARSQVQDALRSNVEYSITAAATYRLSRNHRFTEPQMVFTAPFITEAAVTDPNLGYALRSYYGQGYRKSGLQFRPGGSPEDFGGGVSNNDGSNGSGGGLSPIE